MGKIEERLHAKQIDSKMFTHIVATKCGINEKKANLILSVIVTTIIDLLADGYSVSVAKLGRFYRVRMTLGKMVFKKNILMTHDDFANKVVDECNVMDKYITKTGQRKVASEKVES